MHILMSYKYLIWLCDFCMLYPFYFVALSLPQLNNLNFTLILCQMFLEQFKLYNWTSSCYKNVANNLTTAHAAKFCITCSENLIFLHEWDLISGNGITKFYHLWRRKTSLRGNSPLYIVDWIVVHGMIKIVCYTFSINNNRISYKRLKACTLILS